jgi:hypothetical protein
VLNPKLAVPVLLSLALAGCSRTGEFTETGIFTVRSACPAVVIPAGTGDVTLFNPSTSRDADAVDLVATITNVRSSCTDAGDHIITNVTFDVQAQRRNATGPRQVVLPYFAAAVHAGNNVVSKRLSRVGVHFADGEYRATTSGSATGQVLRAAATLPEDIRREISRERRAGDADAAIDPLADPRVRAAVQRATFELMLGFQLTEDQLRYNATR